MSNNRQSENHHKFTKEFLITVKNEIDLMLSKLDDKYFSGSYIIFEREVHDNYNIKLDITTLNESNFTNE